MNLVLLPGLDGTGILFRPLLDVLPPELQPIVINYPGKQPLGYDDLLSTVRAQLPDEPYVLLGESFGGPIAIRLAAEQPNIQVARIEAGHMTLKTRPLESARAIASFVRSLPFINPITQAEQA